MKKYWPFILIICCFGLVGCNADTENNVSDFSIEKEVSSLSDIGSSFNDNQTEKSENNSENTSLDEAVISAVFDENKGKYLPGECQGVGYKIFETFSDGENISVYALIEYIEYRFQDDLFVNISGSRANVLLEFKMKNHQSYELMNYILLDSNSGLSDEELEELIAPLKETGKDYTYTDVVFQELRSQADSYAEEYLQLIGRDAAICERKSHEEDSLLALGVNEDVYFMLIKSEATNIYPDWNGTCERIEDGIRYVYQTYYDDISKEIEYTKTKYETKETVEKMTFDSVTGNAIE